MLFRSGTPLADARISLAYTGNPERIINEITTDSEGAVNLEDAGFKNLGVDERKNLVVLKRTKMPAVLVEAGFINNDKDNYLFDEEFDSIAQAIADGILESIPSGRPGNTTSNKSNRTDNKTSDLSAKAGIMHISFALKQVISVDNIASIVWHGLTIYSAE